MAIVFSDKEWEVFCNIVSGVESGGQIYGNGNWGDITEAYVNTPNECAITIGSYQFFGPEAHQVVQLIKDKYPSTFSKYDNADIAADLKESDWSHYQISKTSNKAKAIKNMISSADGIKAQKEVFKSNSQKHLEYAYNLGITDHKALAMAMQIAHLGNISALKRIISKTSKPYTVASIDAALRTDNQNSSQVGAKIFRSRHDCVIKWLDQYWPKDNNVSTSNSSSNSSNVNNNTGGKTSMAKTYPAGYISNSGHDENNKYYGGKAGDQTGTEWQIRSWYNRPWTHVLHYPNANVRKTIAQLAIEAALNNNIGYDQYERTTFWYQLAKVGYHPANIKTPCESDCSAGATACCKAAGYLHNISGLKNLSPDNYTGSMVDAFRAAGFEIRTASKYLSSPDYVCAGDVLLNDHHHTTICISSGAKTGEGLTVYDENSISTTTSSSNTSSSSNDALNETVKSYIYANKAQVALRTWAGKDNSQLKSFPTVVKGQKLGLCDTVKASDGSAWYFVKIEDKYGFVDSADTSTTEPTASTTTTNSTNNGRISINGVSMAVSNGSKFNTTSKKWTGICNAKILNLRRWAGTDSALLSSVPNIKYGTTVYVYDVLLDSEGAPWLYIKVKNPTTGKYVWAFCYAAYITKV